MRDHFELSGDFRGAVVNINSSLDLAEQSAAKGAFGIEADKASIQDLLSHLRAALVDAGPANAEDAEALAVSTQHLIEAASSDRPNRSLIATSIKAVREGGMAFLTASPAIAATVNDIVDTVQKIHDLVGK